MPSHPRASAPVLKRIARAARGCSSTLREDLVCYAYDATDIHSLPDIVVWPESTGDVAAVVGVAHGAGVPLVARGAGTGYTGGSVPIAGGVVLSFERMNRVLDIDTDEAVAVVEPGIVNEDLRARAMERGLTFPPDPASLKMSTVGGNVAEGAAGPRTVLYGRTGDYVIGLEFVLADGHVVATGYLADERADAWDPAQLVVGSEGTLAIVTKAAVRLTEIPELTVTCWAEFPSLAAAARAVAAITAAGVPVSVLEIIDRDTLACSLEYVRGERPENPPAGALLIELEGSAADVRRGVDAVGGLLDGGEAGAVRWAEDQRERDELWEVRRSISASLARLSTGKINEDITVPRSRIPDYVERLRGISEQFGLPILTFGHAGDGNLHVNIIVDRGDRDQMTRARRAVTELFDAALSMGGTLSGEHGIGITKAEHLSRELDAPALDVTRAVKRALDPDGVLNPDKVMSDRPNPWWRDLDDDTGADGGGSPGNQESRC